MPADSEKSGRFLLFNELDDLWDQFRWDDHYGMASGARRRFVFCHLFVFRLVIVVLPASARICSSVQPGGIFCFFARFMDVFSVGVSGMPASPWVKFQMP